MDQLNSNKSKMLIKWNCILNFSETIKMVSEWYKSFYNDPKNIHLTTINQIKTYQKLLSKKIQI